MGKNGRPRWPVGSNLMSKWEDIDRKLSSIAAAVAGLGVIISIALVVIGVIGRYILNLAIIFIDEYTGYLLVLTTFMGLAYTLRTDGHIDVDLVGRHLPPKIKSGLRIVTTLVALVLTILLTIYTGGKTWSAYQMGLTATSSLETPLFIPQLVIPIGFVLLALSLFTYLLKMVRALSTGKVQGKDGH